MLAQATNQEFREVQPGHAVFSAPTSGGFLSPFCDRYTFPRRGYSPAAAADAEGGKGPLPLDGHASNNDDDTNYNSYFPPCWDYIDVQVPTHHTLSTTQILMPIGVLFVF